MADLPRDARRGRDLDRKKDKPISRKLILETVDPDLFSDYWDVGHIFRSYLETFDDVAIAIALTLLTISSEDFDKWNKTIH